MRVLNLGGVGNADVLLVSRAGAPPAIVKDYGRRPAAVRRWLAPLLVRHELAMLERLEGLPGIPRPLGRIGSAALAMEYLEGTTLRRRSLGAALPSAFFDALEGIVDGISQRGVAYLDLRSPSNVLCTPTGAPALVDLGSAYRLPLPPAFRRWHDREALAKLRRRFEAGGPELPKPLLPGEDGGRDLKVRGLRIRLVEAGRYDDPVPALLLHDAGSAGRSLVPLLARAEAHGRRALVPDLPGFGDSARPRRGIGPPACAARLLALLDGLRLPRVDVVGHRWGGLVARELAVHAPPRVRSLLTFDTPLALEGELATRLELARSDPEALVARVERELPAALAPAVLGGLRDRLRRVPARILARAYREIPAGPWPLPEHPWGVAGLRAERGELPATARGLELLDPLREPDRLWQELAALSA